MEGLKESLINIGIYEKVLALDASTYFNHSTKTIIYYQFHCFAAYLFFALCFTLSLLPMEFLYL